MNRMQLANNFWKTSILMLSVVLAACGGGGGGGEVENLVAAPNTPPPVVSDAVSPVVLVGQSTPFDGAMVGSLFDPVVIVFSEAMDESTVNTLTIRVEDSLGEVPGMFITSDGKTFTFTHDDGSYADGSEVFVTITTGVTDLAGNAVAEQVKWSFFTPAGPPSGPVP